MNDDAERELRDRIIYLERCVRDLAYALGKLTFDTDPENAMEISDRFAHITEKFGRPR